jgi:hypothetical protein
MDSICCRGYIHSSRAPRCAGEPGVRRDHSSVSRMVSLRPPSGLLKDDVVMKSGVVFKPPSASRNRPRPAAAGRGKGGRRPSRRDAQRPSGDQCSRHAVPEGSCIAVTWRGLSGRSLSADCQRPKHGRSTPWAVVEGTGASPQTVRTISNRVHKQPIPFIGIIAGQRHMSMVTVDLRSRGESSRCTRLCRSAVNRRHWRARAGPASRQLLAHDAMPRMPRFRSFAGRPECCSCSS